MINPKESDIGRGVIYTAPHGYKESGKISSISRNWVFVRYGSGNHGIATRREDLEWEFPGDGDKKLTDPKETS
jgi:hypothetical protein